ncbi:hypothetical protein HZB88_00285 [archaeon]|nr:hypothetical protein [archaeon]
MAVLNIYIAKGKNLVYLDLIGNKHVTLSLYPFLPEHVAKKVQTFSNANHYVSIGQWGTTHKCMHKHNHTDRYHENNCLYHSAPSLESQIKQIKEGEQRLRNHGFKNIVSYAPSNHLYNKTTILALRRRRRLFLFDLGMISIQPYVQGTENMPIIVPESKFSHLKNTEAVYCRLDEITEQEFSSLLKKDLSPLLAISPETVLLPKILLNKSAKHLWKFARDLAKISSIRI